MSRGIETISATWNGIQLEITWEPCWLGIEREEGWDTAHITVTAVQPYRAPLPITETGYRSHFTTAETVESYGGPAAFVLTWLAEEAATPAWRQLEAASRQLALF